MDTVKCFMASPTPYLSAIAQVKVLTLSLTSLCEQKRMVFFVPRQEPALELLPYSDELRAEIARQVAEKHERKYVRGQRQTSPYNVWYAHHQRG